MILAVDFAVVVGIKATAPEAAVREFYRRIVVIKPLGIPTGNDKKALWPLMSERLVRTLDTAEACERDYFRQHAPNDKSKPEFGWLEDGLFSGGNEKALPAEVIIIETQAFAPRRFRVFVQFTYRETFDTYGKPPDPKDHFSWPGEVMVDCSTGHCLIDDFLPRDGDTKQPLPALSESFPGCRGAHWVGEAR